MSKIQQVAQLIRLAASDDDYARDLYEALVDDPGASEILKFGRIDERDLGQLNPAEWQWFANWRQSSGGGLDEQLLNYLTDSATTRFARFQVRALVLRDPQTNRNVIGQPAADLPADTGVRWLDRQARLTRIGRILGLSEIRNDISDRAFDRLAQGEEGESPRFSEAEVEAELERRARRDIALQVEVEHVLRGEVDELITDALQCATHASWFLLRLMMTAIASPLLDRVEDRLTRYADEHGLERGWFLAGGAPA